MQPTEEDGLAIVSYSENSKPNATTPDCDDIHCDTTVGGYGTLTELVVPDVLQNDELSDLKVKQMGVGRIGARFTEKDGVSDQIHRIWCEWIGNKELVDEDIDVVPEHEFAIVIFPYNYNLGRKDLFDGFRYLLTSSTPHSEADGSGFSRGKKRKSFSDPEDISEALSQYESSGEDSQSSNNTNSKMVLAGNDDQLVSQILSSRTMRKELRKQQRVASERSCGICQQKMLPNKDVAALLNRRTGKLVCSSRNFTGAFHVFHISCLMHWVMLCEVKIYAKQSAAPKAKRRSQRKVKSKYRKNRDQLAMEETKKQICSAFCPECQGTGVRINEEELEKPSVPLYEENVASPKLIKNEYKS